MLNKKIITVAALCATSGFVYYLLNLQAGDSKPKPMPNPITAQLAPALAKQNTQPQNKPELTPVESTEKAAAEDQVQQPPQLDIIDDEPGAPESLIQLHFLQSCYDDNIIDCGYPNNDPRQTSFLIGQDIKNELQSLLDQWKGGEIDEKVLSQAALESIANPDGHVQQAALEVLSELPTSQSHYNSMLETLAASYNAKIIKLIMLEAQRYKTEYALERLDQIYIQQLKTGAPYASQEVAKNLLPFFNEYNIGSYKQTLNELPAKTKKAQLLKANIEEYERMQASG